MATITVTIDSKVYRIACDEGQEEYLLGLAERLDGKITNLRHEFGEIGDLRLIVMAALTVMDELTECQKQVEQLKLEIDDIHNTQNSLAQVKLQEMTKRVQFLSDKLSEQLAHNEKNSL